MGFFSGTQSDTVRSAHRGETSIAEAGRRMTSDRRDSGGREQIRYDDFFRVVFFFCTDRQKDRQRLFHRNSIQQGRKSNVRLSVSDTSRSWTAAGPRRQSELAADRRGAVLLGC